MSEPGKSAPTAIAATSAPSQPAVRRQYETPRLTHLGSVRELTLGGSSGVAEGAGTFIMAM